MNQNCITDNFFLKFEYGEGPAGAPLQLEIHVDLLCPDSAAVWPTMMELKSHYGNSLNLKVHNFILPYHRQSFETATVTKSSLIDSISETNTVKFWLTK